MATLTVCIATHERAQLLPRALDGLMNQERPPNEVVISDSSGSPHAKAVVDSYVARHEHVAIIYRHSPRRALPWQRWFAFQHSSGQTVLFLDDDVWLAPTALGTLERAYDELSATHPGPVAGIGFVQSWDDGSRPTRDATTLRERWLGTSRRPAGTLTPGGLTVSSHGLTGDAPVRVHHLWGGAMSYRREVLLRIGFLDRLAVLYEAGIGRGEDAVLSVHARRHGDLYAITQPLARHPWDPAGAPAPYATRGWRLGLTGTWSRAHTLRWIAEDPSAYLRDLSRVISLELARSAVALLRRPWGWLEWQRVAGACVGSLRVATRWSRIPRLARSIEGTEGVFGRGDASPDAAAVRRQATTECVR